MALEVNRIRIIEWIGHFAAKTKEEGKILCVSIL